MRVSVIEEKTGRVIIDGSSNINDERRVHLDSIEVSSDKAYLIKYEFFEKRYGKICTVWKHIQKYEIWDKGMKKVFLGMKKRWLWKISVFLP